MKLEIEVSEELASRLAQVGQSMAISPEEAVAFLLGSITAGIVPKPAGGEAQAFRRLQLTQGAGLLLQSCLMGHEDPEKVWELFRDFYDRLEAMIFAEEFTAGIPTAGDSGVGE